METKTDKGTFEKLLEQMSEDEATLKVAVEDIPRTSRPGYEIRKRQAEDRISQNKKLYVSEVKNRGFAIFLDGDRAEQQKFADIAEDEGETITIDSQALYDRLATEMYPSMGKSVEMTSHQIGYIQQSLAQVSTELNIVGYPPLKNLITTYAGNYEGVKVLVKDLIRRSMGDDLNKVYIEHLTGQKAVKERYTNTVVPVVITGATIEEISLLAPTLFSGTYLVVNVDEQGATKEAVIKTFNAVKKVLKSKQSN